MQSPNHAHPKSASNFVDESSSEFSHINVVNKYFPEDDQVGIVYDDIPPLPILNYCCDSFVDEIASIPTFGGVEKIQQAKKCQTETAMTSLRHLDRDVSVNPSDFLNIDHQEYREDNKLLMDKKLFDAKKLLDEDDERSLTVLKIGSNASIITNAKVNTLATLDASVPSVSNKENRSNCEYSTSSSDALDRLSNSGAAGIRKKAIMELSSYKAIPYLAHQLKQQESIRSFTRISKSAGFPKGVLGALLLSHTSQAATEEDKATTTISVPDRRDIQTAPPSTSKSLNLPPIIMVNNLDSKNSFFSSCSSPAVTSSTGIMLDELSNTAEKDGRRLKSRPPRRKSASKNRSSLLRRTTGERGAVAMARK